MTRLMRGLTVTAVMTAGTALAGCTGRPAACPQLPAPPAVASVQTPRAESTNVNLELSYRFMRTLIRERLEGPSATDPAASSGARVSSVALSQDGSGASLRNLVTVGLVPWFLSSRGRTDLPRQFRLVLQIRPHLVTADVQPDAQIRRQWLAGADEGVALTFGYSQLWDVSLGRDVVCPQAGAADPIGDQVLRGVYDGLRDQVPTVIPADLVTDLAASLTGGQAKVKGANLATDGALKLGFTLDSGSPRTFSPETLVMTHHPSDDWGFELDTSLVSRLVAAKASGMVEAKDAVAKTDSVTVDFSSQGLFVTVKATHRQNNPCPDIHITATSLTKVSVRQDSAGRSVLIGDSGDPTIKDDAGGFAALCFIVDKLLFGEATMVIGPAAGNASCPDALGPPLSFDFGTDTFYGTSIDTDETFSISGRSKHVDAVLLGATPPVQRPPVAAC
jgi:hypothetical protein